MLSVGPWRNIIEMYEDTYPEVNDIEVTIRVPFEEIWFVQHMIEDMDGLGLVTSGREKKAPPGTIHVLTTQDRINELNELIIELKRFTGDLEIVHVECS